MLFARMVSRTRDRGDCGEVHAAAMCRKAHSELDPYLGCLFLSLSLSLFGS